MQELAQTAPSRLFLRAPSPYPRPEGRGTLIGASFLKSPTGRERGFSLVEALVALAVFALAGVALVELQAHSLMTLSRVEERALGGIVAQNQLVEAAAAARSPDLGAREGESVLAGRRWAWRIVVEATSAPETRRVSIAVFDAASGEPAGAAHAFVTASAGAP